jgi:hypothetical protein
MKPGDVYTAAAQLAPEGSAARLGGLVTWKLSCTSGSGNCSASITPLPPGGDLSVKLFAATSFVPKTGKYKGVTLYRKGKAQTAITCNGPCKATTTGTFFLQVNSSHDLLPSARAGKTITIPFKINCVTSRTQNLKFVFDARGNLSLGKSTLR